MVDRFSHVHEAYPGEERNITEAVPLNQDVTAGQKQPSIFEARNVITGTTQYPIEGSYVKIWSFVGTTYPVSGNPKKASIGNLKTTEKEDTHGK